MRSMIYNLSNMAGILLISVGAGAIKFEYGLIVAGIVLVALNLYNDRTSGD